MTANVDTVGVGRQRCGEQNPHRLVVLAVAESLADAVGLSREHSVPCGVNGLGRLCRWRLDQTEEPAGVRVSPEAPVIDPVVTRE